VTTTGPAGKWKTFYSDMAGGLITAAEPNPTNASNPVTYCYLNGWGQITQASVQRDGVARMRATPAWQRDRRQRHRRQRPPALPGPPYADGSK
jgi:hypothetical protein